MINFAVKSDSNDKNLNYVNIKKCLTKNDRHDNLLKLSQMRQADRTLTNKQ